MIQQDVDEIVFRLLRKRSLAETGFRQLEDLVKDYPYFPLTRFLLARKAIENELPGKEEYMEKAAVYIPDVHWLQYILHDGLGDDRPAIAVEEEEHGREEEDMEDHMEDGHVGLPEEDQTAFPEEYAPGSEEEPVPETEQEVQQMQAQAAPEVENDLAAQVHIRQETTDPAEQAAPPAATGDTPIPVDQSLRSVISELKSASAKPVAAEDVPIPVDPYHSIDYFASQGIHLKNEDLNKDQMGRQLKKFTEWLKTMKRIPASESAADIDDATNQNIQNIAAHSIAGTEIVTEAMAEVLVKQKKYDRAIEMYRKLSLQNPAKSTYFASLIEDLNKLLS